MQNNDFSLRYKNDIVMKKTFFTLMLMLASALAINAQSLTGKDWCTMVPDEDGQQIALEMKFENNAACEITIATVQDMKESGMKMSIAIELDIPGTYKLDGQDLSVNLNNEKAKNDLDVDIEGVDAQTKAMMIQMIKPELEKGKAEAKKELIKMLPNMGNMKVVSLDNHRLILADSTGAEMTFYAK